MKTLVSWSSGKDSAWTLHVLRQDPTIEIVGLLTTVNAAFDRVAMHGVRRTVLTAQAEAAGLPLFAVDLPWPCSNEVYEERMGAFVREAQQRGVEQVAFGDLFLEDIRAYREAKLAGTGLRPIFPLWGHDTAALARAMLAGGLETFISVVDTAKLDAGYSGRAFDDAFLHDLPPGIDPCGENGEFHTCVAAGPMFNRRLAVTPGEQVTRDGFCYTDFTLAS